MSNFLKKLKEMWDPIDGEFLDQEDIEKDFDIGNKNITRDHNQEFDTSNKVLNLQNKSVRISCFKPEDYGSKTVIIANELISGSIVIIDLSGVSDDVARRIIDFLRGIVHAKDGKFMKVAVNTYVLVPKNTDISGSDVLNELNNNVLMV